MSEQIHEWFEKHESEHIKWERIPSHERLHSSRRLCAFLKIAAMMPDPAKWSLHGEHDIVYLADPDDLVAVTEDDVIYLLRCGVHWSSECDCLAMFC